METNTEMQIFDIYDIWYVPLYKLWYVKVGIFVLILIAMYVIYKIWTRKKLMPAIILTPWQQLSHQVANLKNDTISSTQEKYARLTVALKSFIEHEYHLPHSGMTDLECMNYVGSLTSIPTVVTVHLKKIFEDATDIKFGSSQGAEKKYMESLQHTDDILREIDPRNKSETAKTP